MSVLRIRLRDAPAPRVLDWDLENRPLAYLGPEFTTAEITAIAASWMDETRVHCWLLGVDDPIVMLNQFRALYDAADIVTGHYLLRHDLPVLNGALLEYGLPPLAPKLVSDTKVHLVKRKYISASQEALAGMFGMDETKHHMSNAKWREANRLTPEGITQTRKRVIDDVVQHKALRQKLIALGALKPPTVWRP